METLELGGVQIKRYVLSYPTSFYKTVFYKFCIFSVIFLAIQQRGKILFFSSQKQHSFKCTNFAFASNEVGTVSPSSPLAYALKALSCCSTHRDWAVQYW